MTERSHVARRTARNAREDFPARPTLSGSAPCHGMAFVLRHGAPLPDLRPIRDSVAAMWRGRLPGDDSRTLFLAAFTRPLSVDLAAWPAALPLVRSGSGVLSSFVRDAAPSPDAAPAASAAELRTCELWWAGHCHRIALAGLETLPLAGLWDMPRLHIHLPVARRRAAAETREPSAARSGEGEGERDAEGVTPVSRAGVSIERDGADLLRDMAERLSADEQRVRLSSILRQALRGLAGRGAAGGGTRPGGTGTAGAARQAPRQPGLLANLAGWLRWHTPLGQGLRDQYDKRLGLVEKLITSGDLDGALRLALKLGSGDPSRKTMSRYPNALPEMRARLDFDLAHDGFSAPILNNASFYALRARYLQLAEQLERDGDFRRAAYIHAQLMGDHHRAVLVLEKGELFSEAAKLAIDSRQPPALAIRMLFQSGDLDTALALAKRTACFDQLAEDSRVKHPAFHAFVIKAWTDMLVATGQPLRALQVTDHLTAAAPVDDALLTVRRRWLAAALGADGAGAFGGELAVRAILTAQWNGDDLSPEAAGAFPHVAVRSTGPHAGALDWLQKAVRGDTEQPEQSAIDLLAALARFAVPASPEQAAFWKGPAQPLLEGFTRAVIATASSRLSGRDLQALRSILGGAGLGVLEADIGKLSKLHVAPAPPEREWDVPPAAFVRPAVRCACVLGNGNMLVWRESRLLQLLDPYGALLWQQNVSDVSALVPVGSSSNAILVQRQQDGTSLLTRFATHNRGFHTIGKIALTAHHDVTSESQWLVQIEGEIGALDLAKLCAPSPRMEFLWSCALTDRLYALACAHHAAGPSWVTVDTSSERGGVLEIWTLQPNGKLLTSLCLPGGAGGESPPNPPAEWFWFHQNHAHRLKTMDGTTARWMNVQPWREDLEDSARNFAIARARAGITGIDTVQPGDFGRRHVSKATESIIHVTQVMEAGPPLVVRGAEGLFCVARGVSSAEAGTRPGAGTVLLADAAGRLFVVGAHRLSIF